MWVVGHHNHGGYRVAEDLGRIKIGRAVVVLRDDDTVDRIPQPAPFRALTLAEIAGVLVKKSGYDGFRKIIAYNLIGASIREFAARCDDFSLEFMNAVEHNQPQTAAAVAPDVRR